MFNKPNIECAVKPDTSNFLLSKLSTRTYLIGVKIVLKFMEEKNTEHLTEFSPTFLIAIYIFYIVSMHGLLKKKI